MRKIIILFTLTLFFASCGGTLVSDRNATKAGTTAFEGSFIQSWLVRNWDDQRWDLELKSFKDAGMEYLIFANMMDTDLNGESTLNYAPSAIPTSQKFDSLSKCLKSAQKLGLKVFVGLNFNDNWWSYSWSYDWLMEQMETGNKIVDEILSMYKKQYPDALYGWYWIWEVDNLNLDSQSKWSMLADALNVNLDHINKVAPSMPMMLSPFMNYRVGYDSAGYAQMWSFVFSNAHFRAYDIFSPQDCIGAGGLNLSNEAQWMAGLKDACQKYGKPEFWINIETFDQWYCPASLDRIQNQFDIAKDYAKHIVSFAYCHYYSPNQVCSLYDKAYRQYLKTGKMPQIDAPEKILFAEKSLTSQGVEIKVTPAERERTAGCAIYSSGNLVSRIVLRDSDSFFKYVDKEGSKSSKYCIRTYNVLGVESEAYYLD